MLSFRSADTTKNYLKPSFFDPSTHGSRTGFVAADGRPCRRISPVAVREPGAVVVAALGAGAVVASA
jgi:hypothetical protein